MVLAKSQARLWVVDALRGMCALIVLVHHARTLFLATVEQLAKAAPVMDAAWRGASRLNTEAVLLFFVLSGFSIRLSVEAHPLTDVAALRDYLRRRLQRIVPAYAFALAFSAWVAWLWAPVDANATSLRTLLGNLSFLQTAMGVRGQWFVPYAGNGALWSLSFEMFYYLTFPLLVGLVAGRTQRCLAVLAATLGAVLLGQWLPSPFTMFIGASMIWYFGVELAEVYLTRRLSWPLWVMVCLWLALGALQYARVVPEAYGLWVGCTPFLTGLGFLQFGTRRCLLGPRFQTWLMAPLARLGAISYALYLVHVPVLRACVALRGDHGAVLVGAAALSFGLAYAVERMAAQGHRD